MVRAGFAEVEITPPVGTHKIGWLIDLVSDQVLDPLYARAAVFDNGHERVGFIQLDTLSIRWTQVNDIRERIEKQYGFPGDCIMVSATHNHAGPAIANVGRVKRDEQYIETLVNKCVELFGAAVSAVRPAELGFNHVFDFAAAYNRRVVMRNGTVKTHHSFSDPEALCLEGPIDPELAVLAAREKDAKLLGCLVNYSCHPTHHGGGPILSAGYPGVLAAKMKTHDCPVTLFLNGACGNTHTTDVVEGEGVSMTDVGRRLAEDACRALETMTFADEWPLAAARTTIRLPYRKVSDEEIAGTVHGAERFVDPAAYDEGMPGLIQRIRERGTQPAEVQALSLGNVSFVSIPAEYFVEHGLRIKEESYPRHALVVSCANGMVGYVPTKHAFKRGGYETTFAPSSRLAPEAGDLLADAAIKLIRSQKRQT